MDNSKKYDDAFCRMYDVYGWNYYSEMFSENILKWKAENELKIDSSLDLGCGSGILCNILHNAGIKASGIDISKGMIETSKSKYKDIHFEEADMVTYMPDEKFDLVTSIYDALNHVLNIEAVEQVFKNVYTYLNDGGFFIFDLVKDCEVESTDYIDIEETEDGMLCFKITRSDDYADLEIFLKHEDSYEKIETIKEKIYDPKPLMELLEKTGFRGVALLSSLTGDSDTESRLQIVCARK